MYMPFAGDYKILYIQNDQKLVAGYMLPVRKLQQAYKGIKAAINFFVKPSWS